MKFNKWTLGIATLCVAVLTMSATAQTFQAIPLPYATLPGVALVGNSNNLAMGWTNTTYNTNIVQTWNITTGTMNSVTNVSTNNVVTYAKFDAIGRNYVVIQSDFNSSAISPGGGAEILCIARSQTGALYDNLNNFWVTNTPSGPGPWTGLLQIDMRGYTYGRIIKMLYTDTNSANTYTNLGKYYNTSATHQGLPYGN